MSDSAPLGAQAGANIPAHHLGLSWAPSNWRCLTMMSRLRPLPLLVLVTLGLGACGKSPPADVDATPALPSATTDAAGSPSTATQTADSSARTQVLASVQRFLKASSFHARMTMDGPRPLTGELDFVAPDRYRITMPMGTQVIVGDTMYLDINGKRQQLPVPPGTLQQWRDPLKMDEYQDDLKVEAIGEAELDGHRAHQYKLEHTKQQGGEMRYWIDEHGLPLRIHQSGTTQGKPYTVTIDYSRFDDPAIEVQTP